MAAFDALNIVDSLFAPTGFNPADSSARKQPNRSEDSFASALRDVQTQNTARSKADAAEQKLAQRRLEEQRAAREAAQAAASDTPSRARERSDDVRNDTDARADETTPRRDDKAATAETFGGLISNLRAFVDEQVDAGTLTRGPDGTVSISEDTLNGFSEDVQEQFSELYAYLESYQALAPAGNGFENGAGLPSDALDLAETIQASLQSSDTAPTGAPTDLFANTVTGSALAGSTLASTDSSLTSGISGGFAQQLTGVDALATTSQTSNQAPNAGADTLSALDSSSEQDPALDVAAEEEATEIAEDAETTDANSTSNTQAAQVSAAAGAGRYTPNLNGNTLGSANSAPASASTVAETQSNQFSSQSFGQFSGQFSGQNSSAGGNTLSGQNQQSANAAPFQLTSDASQIITGTSITRAAPSAALTPESIADWTADSRQAPISGGLSSLRGEPSLLNQSLLGGQPSRSVAQQAARQVNLAVTKAVQGGNSEFTVRLNPEELGRVTVRLQFDADGGVKAHVLAQKPETLELLQKDKSGLEKAIADGGSALDGDSLSFSLDDDGKSTGRAFADALLEDRVNEQHAALKAQGAQADTASSQDLGADLLAENEISLDDILPFVTAETGLDIRI